MKKTEYKVFLNPENFWVGQETNGEKILVADKSKMEVVRITNAQAEKNRPSVVTIYNDEGEFQEDKTFSERKRKF